jgi:hypothetical protein
VVVVVEVVVMEDARRLLYRREEGSKLTTDLRHKGSASLFMGSRVISSSSVRVRLRDEFLIPVRCSQIKLSPWRPSKR